MKKTIKIISLVAVMGVILSSGVAFAEEGEAVKSRGNGRNKVVSEEQRQEKQEKRDAVKEQWVASLSDEDKAKYDAYLQKCEELAPLKETLKAKLQENRELKTQLREKIKACREDEDFKLTDEQIAMLKEIKGNLRGHLEKTKENIKARFSADKKFSADRAKLRGDRTKLSDEERQAKITEHITNHMDKMLSNYEDLEERINERIAQADETKALLQKLLATFE